MITEEIKKISWRQAPSISKVVLGGPISIEEVVAVARHGAKVEFGEEYIDRVNRCRAHVDRFSKEEKAIYGITTGLGENWNRFISQEDREVVQRNHVLSHSCSVGEPLEEECVRAMMFVMLQHFGSGHTGMSMAPLKLLAGMLNAGVVPVVPGHGSVGYICYEAHIGSVLIGEGQAVYGGRRISGSEALKAARLDPVVLSTKEGLTIVSGTTSVTAIGALGLYDSLMIAQTADVAGAMSLEVLKGTLMAMDPRIQEVRPHRHQGDTASNVRRLLEDSEIERTYRGHRVQDALSLRCIPQLHGAAKKILTDGLETVSVELNSSVDNPLIFDTEDGGEALMGCNADGSYVGMACDCAIIALTGLAKMSERRLDRTVNHHVSELPAFLNANPGFNNGLMIPQYAAAGLLGEMKTLSHPSTVDNGFTCANQEDYTSMGANAAVKLYRGASLAKYILSVEILNACQAQDFYDIAPSPATKAVHDRVRQEVPKVEQDTFMSPLMEAIARMVKDGEILSAAESVTGPLEF
ncbi:HAL/PAL/TAL family ammonia-lyase [Dethiosulfovibrio salsuginis]|uniref:Histidine ammonia-lyase n=1 Tax=Dethiosulfovibrio salsuginis TaxID=561720 RepID=A0A1X7KAM4_9BACT|nr:aromatic amino acid lyase [Dethiosulfovibrio salsuginis]SMG38219.1 histidine ammonia-lyase [Dethiosulfovibrio salsuginis]